MNIKVCTIDKRGKKGLYEPLIEHYIKIAKPFAKIEVVDIFNNSIAKAQESSPELAQLEYAKALQPYTSQFSVVLDPNAKELDSIEFSKIFEKSPNINFFIGGAYGFDRSFVKDANLSVSFGRITVSHKLVKVLLLEQIYRGLTIINNHPYHK